MNKKSKNDMFNQSYLEILEDLSVMAVEMIINTTTLNIDTAIKEVVNTIDARLKIRLK